MIKKSTRKILLWALAAILVVGLVVAAILLFRKKERLCPLGYAGRHREPYCPCVKGWEGARCETVKNNYGCDPEKGCQEGPGPAMTWKACQAVCKPCLQGCGDLVCDTKTGQCVCDPAVTCHGHGSCAGPNKPYLCTCSNHWDVKTNCETCPAGWGGTDCDQSTAPPVQAKHFPYDRIYNLGDGTTVKLPFLFGGWLQWEPTPPDASMLSYLLGSNFNYITIEWGGGNDYSVPFADFYKQWRAKGKIALMNITPPGCQGMMDTDLFTRCVYWKKENGNCLYANKESAPDPYDWSFNGKKDGKVGWYCSNPASCPLIAGGWGVYDSMNDIKSYIKKRMDQVGDIDGIMLDWEACKGCKGGAHGWLDDNVDRMIPHLTCFLDNLISAGVYVGKKKLIVVDINRWECLKSWKPGIVDLLETLTTQVSQRYTSNFIVLFEIESYFYTGDDYKTCIKKNNGKQRTVSQIVDNVIPALKKKDPTALQFSYFLFPASSGGGDENPMSDVVGNFDELYNSGIISMSFYHLSYYSEADLGLLSTHVEQYLVKG